MESPLLGRLAQHRTPASHASASRVCIAPGCIAGVHRVRQHPAHLSRVPQHRLVLCESEEAEEELLVIDRETNMAPPQFGDRDKVKFKIALIVSENGWRSCLQ
jgi:hypothetical protein